MRQLIGGRLPLLLLVALDSGSTAAQQRPLQVDDLLRFQQIQTAVASPDGKWVAVVITRPRSAGETYRIMPYMWDLDHADIWLFPRRGGESRNLTRGAADGSGYWNPVWSPDGRHLAMLSTKGGDNIRPYVWSRNDGSLRRLVEQGVDPIRSLTEEPYPSFGMLWRDSVTLLVPVLPTGEVTPFISKLRTYRTAVEEWARAERGVTATVSVLESGREVPQAERPMGQLLAIEVVSGKSRVLARGNFRRLLLSPTGRHLAFIAETGRIPPPPLLARADLEGVWRTRLALLALSEGAAPIWIDGVHDPVAGLEWNPHGWSPDGSSFAAVGKLRETDTLAATLFLVSAESNTARPVAPGRLEVSATAWSPGGELLALAQNPSRETAASARQDWWLIDRPKGDVGRRLTATLDTVPTALLATPAPDRLLGLAGGDLWAIGLNGRSANLTAALAPEIQAIVWPTPAHHHVRRLQGLVVRTADNALHRINWQGPALKSDPLPRPTPSSTLAAFHPEQKLTVYTGIEPKGTYLWTATERGQPFVQRIALNPGAGSIESPKRMLIDYQGLDGDSLRALVILPFGYRPGRRYPLVTWVHHGAEVLDTTFYGQLDNQDVSSLNRLLLPAHGYALLIPSMPVPAERAGTDPYLDLPKNVLPAVDRVIQLGVADPRRLGLIGHSYGGYSTYSLVTYTHRFTAAVAIAGSSNLVSNYGTFPGSERYAANAHENLFFPAWSENRDGQGQMYAPPWGNLWRYLRNSPLYFAERVRTPLMIIHGDIDYVPIQQGEEFFTALYRMGKEAKFVRYWGEGHSMESPANMRDMWQRIFAWFDGHFRDDVSRTIGGSATP